MDALATIRREDVLTLSGAWALVELLAASLRIYDTNEHVSSPQATCVDLRKHLQSH